MVPKLELACIFTKYPHSEDPNFAGRLDEQIQTKLDNRFGKGGTIVLLEQRFEDVGNFPSHFYAHIKDEWQGYSKMVNYLNGMAMDLRIYFGPGGITKFLKQKTGDKSGEKDPETFRGWIAGNYPEITHEWVNGMHTSAPDKPGEKEITRDFGVMRDRNILAKTIKEWKEKYGIEDPKVMAAVKKTLRRYGW
jgi:hypothetical protein